MIVLSAPRHEIWLDLLIDTSSLYVPVFTQMVLPSTAAFTAACIDAYCVGTLMSHWGLLSGLNPLKSAPIINGLAANAGEAINGNRIKTKSNFNLIQLCYHKL